MAEASQLITADELQAFAVPRRANVTPDFLQECAVEASLLVRQFVGARDVPPEILKRAAKEVGKNLIARKTGIDGGTSFDGDGVEQLRITRDPLQAARAFLTPYLGIPLA